MWTESSAISDTSVVPLKQLISFWRGPHNQGTYTYNYRGPQQIAQEGYFYIYKYI